MQASQSENIARIDSWNIPGFDLDDFSRRWGKARLSALLKTLAFACKDEPVSRHPQNHSEEQLLSLVALDQRERILRSVFDVSRSLGRSASRHFGVSFEGIDFAKMLPQAGVPCFVGNWTQSRSEAWFLERQSCAWNSTFGHKLEGFGCNYWREALDGLVTGLSDELRLARHRSIGMGCGDTSCLDVLFVDASAGIAPGSATEAYAATLRFRYGPIPDEISQELALFRRQFAQTGIRFEPLGVSEGIFYYRLEAHSGPLCGSTAKAAHQSLKNAFSKSLPERWRGVELRDVTPLAVYGGAS